MLIVRFVLLMLGASLAILSNRGGENDFTSEEKFEDGPHWIELSAGPGTGLGSLAGNVNHDVFLGSIGYAWPMSRVVGGDRWYRGRWSLIGEIFGGEQLNPNDAYIIGTTPLMRYTLDTGSRWVPFAKAGLGPTLTNIGEPDLGGKFQFNIQGGAGTQFFWNKHQALSLEFRLFHLSNAGTRDPNTGINCVLLMVGTSWLF